MKKRLFALTSCVVLSVAVLSGCSASTVQKITEVAEKASEQAETPSDAETTPSPTPAPRETTLALKKTATVGDWKFTVKKTTVKNKIRTSQFMEAKADKGNRLVIASITVTNMGKKKGTFLPMVGMKNTMVTAKLLDKDGREYQPSAVTGYEKDIANKSIKPLEKKSGILVFNIPKKVTKNLKSCKIRIGTEGESVLYPAK